MWKIVGYVLLWGIGSTAAVAVAWTGVSTVDDGIAPPAETSDTAALASVTTNGIGSKVNARADASPSIAPSTELTVETGEPNATGAVDTSSDAEASAATSDDSSTTSTRRTSSSTLEQTQTTTQPTTSTSPSTSRSTRSTTISTTLTPRTTSTTVRATTTTTTSSATQATTSTPTTTTTSAETRTFQLVGGTTAISFSANEVKVLWATPNPGFEVRVEPEGSETRVEFRADHHESRIDVWWSGGPQHDIRERDR